MASGPGSKRRLHEKPTRVQVRACLPWVESELELVRPEALVLLGSTATTPLAGPAVSVTRDRGRALESPHARVVIVTIHPSAVLRARDHADRGASFAGLVGDLRTAVREVGD